MYRLADIRPVVITQKICQFKPSADTDDSAANFEEDDLLDSREEISVTILISMKSKILY